MEQNLIIYHGSQQIVEVPRFGVGKHIMIMDKGFIVQKTLSLQKSGHVQ